jgi:Carboxypeptidase regulatory-like domain/TonB dependent receptor-like, beta-barrel
MLVRRHTQIRVRIFFTQTIFTYRKEIMRTKIPINSIVSCLFILLAVYFIPVVAQSTFSTLVGTATDPQSAVVAGATVTITNKGTTAVRIATTDDAGNYHVANLDSGEYEVTIEAKGFRNVAFKSVTLRARETLRLDAQLAVAGAATETVTVTAGGGITTEVPTIAVAKTNRELQELPVPFRASGTTSPISTLTTQVGVQTDNSGGLSLSGSQRYSTTVTIDGISTVSVRSNGPINELFPSVESIAEIRVSQINNNAEFAQSGDITTISKSGTNDFHGGAFWYHQNRVLDATNPFAPINSATGQRSKPFKIANDFGVSAGGPVRIPWLYDGRDRTFFFATYEGSRLRQQTTRTYSVPPAAWRTGDFSGISTVIRDPLTGVQFPGNRIPADRINEVSRKTLELFYPLPNTGSPNSPSNNLTGLFPAPTDNDQFDVRIDHNLSQRQSLFGRYTWKDRRVSSFESGILPPIGPVSRPEKVWAFTGAYNFIIRPNLLNEFRGGFSGRDVKKDFDLDGAAIIQQLGLQGLSSNLPESPGAPDIAISGITTTGISRGFTTTDRTYQFLDNVTWTKGRHTIKFGADLRRLSTTDLLSFTTGDDFGTFTFDGTVTNTVIGHPFAAFLLGIPDRTQYANTGPDIDGSVWHHGYFIQDDWKVTPRLTVSFGLRYELHPPFTEKNFNITNFDRPTGNAIVPNEEARRAASPGFIASIGTSKVVTAEEAGVPEVLRTTDYNNFTPRVGFAFRPFNNTKTVIRGGYGVYTVSILGSVFYSLTGVHTSDVRAFNNSFNANRVPAFQFPLAFPSGPGSVASVGSQDFRTANQQDYVDPYNQQWSLTFEQELGWNSAMRLTYNGQHAVKLSVGPDLNQIPTNTVGFATANARRPYPNWNIIFTRDNGGTANFHGLTAELNRRFSKGLQLTSSYAWSKNLSDAEGSAPGSFGAENGPRLLDYFNRRADYGNVSFTRRHRFLTTFIWELPVGKGRSFLGSPHRAVEAVLGGWQLSGIVLFQSGPFLTPFVSGGDPSGTGAARRTTQRPDVIGDDEPSSGRTAGQWFNRNSFICPGRSPNDPENVRFNCNIPAPIGRYGYASVGSVVGPGTKNFSMALAKKFYFTERTGLHFEAQFSNLFNRLNLGTPGLNITTTGFGEITSTQTAEGTGPRVIQMGLRLFF